MIIDAKYYCSVLSSFSDIIYDVILYGDDISSVRNAAKAISQNSDRLVIYGTVNELASSAYFDGKELNVAYDCDMESFFYIIKQNSVYKLEEKNGGGFYLDEQKLTNPLRLA